MKNLIQLLAIIVLIATFNFSATAQKLSSKTYNGTVVLTNGKTLEGKIRMLTPSLNEVKVAFVGADGEERIYKSTQVETYSFEVPAYDAKNSVHTKKTITYVRRNVEVAPIAFGPKDVLVHQEAKGSIALFNHYVERPADKKMPIIHTFYVQKDNGQMVSLNQNNYKEILNNMTTEYPELQAKIGTRGYGFKYVGKIVAQYNDYSNNNMEELAYNLK